MSSYPVLSYLGLRSFGSGENIVKCQCQESEQHDDQPNRLRNPFPVGVGEWNLRIRWKPAVDFGMFGVVQHIYRVCSTNRAWIVDTRIREPRHFSQLCSPSLSELLHFALCSEVQTAGRASFDARRFQSGADPIRTQRALENCLGRVVEFRNVERTA